MSEMNLSIYGEAISSRLWVGTAHYPSPSVMQQALQAAQPGFVTLSLRRQQASGAETFWKNLRDLPFKLLPNTAGCHSAREAVTLAEMSRELFETPWIKLEVIGDDYSLQPCPYQLVEAATELVNKGFKVLPYCTDDLIVCQRLLDAGCEALMPLGAPIGTGLGLLNPYTLKQLRERHPNIPLIIDAGLGAPSQAAQAMEWGFDGVLLNTAIAEAGDPVNMALAFREAVTGGRRAFEAGLMQTRNSAQASTPLVDRPFWQQSS